MMCVAWDVGLPVEEAVGAFPGSSLAAKSLGLERGVRGQEGGDAMLCRLRLAAFPWQDGPLDSK